MIDVRLPSHPYAAEAASDDGYFAPDAVETWAQAVFAEAQAAWDARDRERLAKVVGPDLMVEWTRRLDDFERKGERALGQRAGRQDETAGRAGLRWTGAVESRTVETTRGSSGRLLLGLPIVVADPCHHRWEVGALGEDRGSLDDRSPRAMRAR